MLDLGSERADASTGDLDAGGRADAADAAAMDGGLSDAEVTPLPAPCTPGWLDEGVFAAYRFEGGLTDSLGGAPTGTARPEGATTADLTFPPGPTADCGTALAADDAHYVVITDDDDWSDRVRSLDFWFYSAAPPFPFLEGILSRDAEGIALPGHMSLVRNTAGQLALRLQDASRDTADEKICSPATTAEGWVHVGVNLGAPGVQLWVNGVEVDAPLLEGASYAGVFTCQQRAPTPFDIDGNDNPWVLAAASFQSVEGTGEPVERPLSEAAIDELRFSSERREFWRVAEP